MTTNNQDISIIGLGLLGGAIAARLCELGWRVRGFDVDASRRAAAKAAGVLVVDSAVAAAEGAKNILLSLPNSDAVAYVVDELGSTLSPGKVILDTTTCDPDFSEACAAALVARDVAYLAITVIGSSAQARAGHVTLLVGGAADKVTSCEDLFTALSERWFFVGRSGDAARMKLVVNLVLGLNRAALAEGLALAEKMKLAPEQTLEVLQAGAAYSRAMDAKGQKMLDRDYTPQARLAQHLKDVRLILAAGEQAGASLPLSRLHQSLLESSVAAGRGDLDNSAIIEIFRDEAS